MTGRKRTPGRDAEMQVMRNRGMTLAEIGKEFGISRQAVSFCLGPVGRRPVLSERLPKLRDEEWLRKQKEAGRSDTSIGREVGCSCQIVGDVREKFGILGLREHWIQRDLFAELLPVVEAGITITSENLRRSGHKTLSDQIAKNGGFYYWRMRMGQRLSEDSPTRKGRSFQWLAYCVLSELGYDPVMMPWRHPFDIILGNGLEIEVKGANRNAHKQGFCFSLRDQNTGKSLVSHFLVAGCMTTEQAMAWYVIPVDRLDNKSALYIGKRLGRWTKYREAWGLLDVVEGDDG